MKRWIPMLVVVLAAAAMLAYGPIPQLRDYHAFADRRPWLGIPNAADVLSNLAFVAVALWGATRLPGARAALGDAWKSYGLFVVALALTAAGSGFYHWAPDNARLVFDRLPIALACAGLLAAVHAETLGAPQPRWVLPFLGAAAIASVLWWWRTESLGAGDLRPYLLLQGAPLVLIPLWQALHGAPRSRRVAFAVAIALYALAKAAELADHAIFDMTGWVSGHTLKHLLSAAAGAVIVAEAARAPAEGIRR